jgi:rhodanese-related sulfurtransferase
VRTLRSVEDAVALRDRVQAGARRAVVLGAGFIGIEAAEALAQRGLHTTVVEFAPHVLPPLEDELAALVTAELRTLGIEVRAGTAATAVESGEDGDVVVLDDGTRLDADIVVLSVGVRPDTAVFEAAGVACVRGAMIIDEHGRTSLPDVYAVGDATASVDAVTGAVRPVALAGPANRAGRLVADAILRPEHARPLPRPVGTAIVRVGAQTVAMTGANRAALAAAGIDADTLHLHPGQHAGYFPGASQIHLVVHIRRSDGLLLGAQAVGADGVDKRIDVLATAIRAGWAVDELIDLDLAYAPPYGSREGSRQHGRDGRRERPERGPPPLVRAGRRRGRRDRADPRRAHPAELSTGHLPGALAIPHTALRGRLDEVRAAAAGRPVRVMCQSGVRSAIAHRVLAQAGFDSASLSGGMLTLRAVLGEHADAVLVSDRTRV